MVEERPEELLEIVEDQATSDLRTSIPAVVRQYDHDEQRAAVQPVVDARFLKPDGDEDLEFKRPPVIPNCPVAFQSSTAAQVTFPLKTGDTVLVVFAERSIDEWMQTGAEAVQPTDNRRHNISDAMVFPSLRSFANAVSATDTSAYVVNTSGGIEIHLGSVNPSSYVALADAVKSELDSIWNALNNHTHPGVVTGDKSTGPSSASGSASKPAASKTKAE